jgi:hypothetical protein
LVLPRSLLAITAEFDRFRIIWFVLEIVVFAGTLVVIARWIGGASGRKVLILTGLVLAAVPTAMTLQMGNLQIIAFAIAMLAMVLIESELRSWKKPSFEFARRLER